MPGVNSGLPWIRRVHFEIRFSASGYAPRFYPRFRYHSRTLDRLAATNILFPMARCRRWSSIVRSDTGTIA